MTRREDAFSPLGAKAVCIPDASCLSQQYFLFGEPTGYNDTEPAFFGPSRMTAMASHGHLGHLAPDVRRDRGTTAEGFQDWPGLLMH